MATTWTLSTVEVIRGAMQLCQAIGVGEPIDDDDADMCMGALDGILKELPILGYSGPQLTSTPVAITWSIGTPSTVTPPTDFFGAPVLKFTDQAGIKQTLLRIPRADYELLDQPKTADYPERYYVAPDLTFKLWPVPTKNPGLTLSYQSIIPDLTSLTGTPVVPQQFLNSLQYLLADEVSLKFAVPQDVRVEIGARATQRRTMMLQWAVDTAPICFQVIDGDSYYPRSPLSW